MFNSLLSEEKIISNFKKIQHNKINIEYENWKTFKNDQNSGKDTVVIAFKLNNEIMKFQQSIVKNLNRLKSSNIKYENEWERII